MTLLLRLLPRCCFSTVYRSDLCIYMSSGALQLTWCCTCAESRGQRRQHSPAQSCLCYAGGHLPLSLHQPDISRLKSNLQQEWDHARNCHLGSVVVKPYSTAKFWWRCDKCPDGRPHEWECEVRHRTQGSGCPFCSSRAVCTHNSLATLAPRIAKDWDYAENDLTPSHYTWKSEKVVSWKCHVCSHQWDVSIASRVHDSTGCPECYDARRGYKEDGTRTSHPSLAATSHSMMLQYDYALNVLAGLDPAKIKCVSHKKVHWICHNCPKGQVHRWTVSPNQRFHHKGRGCPYCSNRRLASAIRCKPDVQRLLLSGTTAEMSRHQMTILLGCLVDPTTVHNLATSHFTTYATQIEASSLVCCITSQAYKEIQVMKCDWSVQSLQNFWNTILYPSLSSLVASARRT